MSAYEKLYGFMIKVYAGNHANSEIIEIYRWSGYKFEQFMKWQWYFEYRAALLRVKYPKNYISARHFNEQLTIKSEIEILETKISQEKGQITKIKNAVQKAEQHWDQLFPIEEDEYYQKAKAKLYAAEITLRDLTTEREKINIKK